jgi:Na+-translocating ferredoxin:NAD+ oxidoreductase RnfG subunit
MRYFYIIAIFSITFLSFDLSKSGVKKMDKTLDKLWPENVVTKKAINLLPETQKKISFKLSDNTIYQVLKDNNVVSYAYLSKGFGKMNEFDYMIVFNKNLSIQKVKVLVYREEQGGEIGSSRWLKQFKGKSDPKKMKFGYDIQNISGATLSARSLTEDTKKVIRKMKELKQKGII